MVVKSIMERIAEHIAAMAVDIDQSEIDNMVGLIKNADRIFVLGVGRSGLAARAFCMRLVQLGLTAYVVGETITPGMKEKDLLIVVSGSGETRSVVQAVRVAREIKVKILSVTSYAESSLGKLSDYVLVIKGKTKIDIEKNHVSHQIKGVHSSLTPLGTLFEDTVMIFLDGVIAELMTHLGKGEEDMKDHHATIE